MESVDAVKNATNFQCHFGIEKTALAVYLLIANEEGSFILVNPPGESESLHLLFED